MWRVKDWWYNFKRGIKNLYHFAPAVWKTNDWDYTSIYDLMEIQMKRLIDSGIENKRIELCLSLLPVLREEYEEMYEYYDAEFDLKPVEGGNSYTLELRSETDNLEQFFERHRAKERIARKALSHRTNLTNYSVAAHITHQIKEQARRIFFNTMRDKIESWWN